MDDKAFWLIVRRSLLAIVAAVDARFGTGKPEQTTPPARVDSSPIRR